MHRGSRLGIVDFSSDNESDDEKISYCKHCFEYGFKIKLRNRIYPDNEQIPIEHENWLQCHECGSIVPIYEIEKEASIKDVVETVDNPFDIGKSFLGIDSTTSIGGKKARKKKERQRALDDIKDDDLKRELARGNTLISYIEHQSQ